MASAIVNSICSALSLTDFYKYVLNSMSFHSKCCDMVECDCQTDKVELSDDDDDNDGNVKLVEACCTGLKDIYTDSENEDEELESGSEELVINV